MTKSGTNLAVSPSEDSSLEGISPSASTNANFSSEYDAGTGKEESIYTKRFSEQQDLVRTRTWQILCKEFLQSYINPSDTVIDLGAGDGNFIRNIDAARRIAVDSSPHVKALEAHGIEVYQVPAHELSNTIQGKADVVFMSNFLEHLTEKKAVLAILEECTRVLQPGGRVIILQPNIRYVGNAYWDYIDHHIALTEHSLVEALNVTGYTIDTLIPRFLPYTAKSRIGRTVGGVGNRDWLVRLYLKLPILWSIFGQQTFVIGRTPR